MHDHPVVFLGAEKAELFARGRELVGIEQRLREVETRQVVVGKFLEQGLGLLNPLVAHRHLC